MATTDYQQAYIEQIPNYRTRAPNPKAKLLVILIIFLVLGGVFFGVTTLLGSSSSSQSSDSLVRAISRQQEITALINAHGKNVVSSDTANFVIRTEILLLSHTQEIESFTGKTATEGQSPVNSSTINETLTRAAQGTNFDQEIETVLEDLITANLSDIENAFIDANDGEFKDALNAVYVDQQSLIE